MIPAFPMDGGRVLRALLASSFGYVRATEIAASIGQFVAFALGFIGLMYNPILIFIAIFVYLAASSEAHMVALRAVSRGVPVSDAMMTQFATLAAAARISTRRCRRCCTRPGRIPGGRRRRQADRRARPRRPDPRHQDARSGRRVADAMGAELPVVSHRATLEQAFKLLQQKQAPAVGVTDAAGTLIGLVTGETIAEMMMLQAALPRDVEDSVPGAARRGLEVPKSALTARETGQFSRLPFGLFRDYIAPQ